MLCMVLFYSLGYKLEGIPCFFDHIYTEVSRLLLCISVLEYVGGRAESWTVQAEMLVQ